MQPRTYSTHGIRLRAVACLLATLTAGLAARVTQAQNASDYRGYAVQHADVHELRGILMQVLPPGSEVLADPTSGRLLIGGGEDVQNQARQLIDSLDQPGDPAPAGSEAPAKRAKAASPEPVLKVYRCNAEQFEQTVSHLRSRFGQNQGVRIVPDARTSQLLVVAPPQMHAAVATSLLQVSTDPRTPQPAAQIGYGQTGSANRNGGARSPQTSTAVKPLSSNGARGTRVEDVDLENTTATRLEQVLRDNLGERLEPIPDPQAPPHTYQIPLSSGEKMGLVLDTARNRVRIAAPNEAMPTARKLVEVLDQPRSGSGEMTTMVSLRQTSPATAERATEAIRMANESGNRQFPKVTADGSRLGNPMLDALLAQAEAPAGAEGTAEEDELLLETVESALQAGEGAEPTEGEPAPDGEKPGAPGEGGLVGPVQIEYLEGLDVLVVRGNRRDVQRVMQIIQQIERLSAETEPVIRVRHLRHVNSESLLEIVQDVYEAVYLARRGDVSITALVKPNALLLVGRQESIQSVLELVEKLDRPVDPAAEFQVFFLKHASALTVEETLTTFYEERGGLGTRILVASDYRSNSVVVHAAPRDMREIEAMVEKLDTPTSEAVNEIKVFRLKNSLATELAPVLQEAVSGQLGGGRGVVGQTVTGQLAQAQRPGGQQGLEVRSTRLRLVTVDRNESELLESGILTDVRITADSRTNTLVVAAPADSMPLITALVKELDGLPAAESQVKVFTILNGDAQDLMDMLQSLFGETTTAATQPAFRTGAQEGESALIPLRFAVDVRTNSIIATGSAGDLTVVEAILLRLDEADVQKRETIVFRLKNAPAVDVAQAINEYLNNERSVRELTPGLMSTFELVEQEVVVVPEPVSNALIVSATPEYFDEIVQLVEDLDERPPMVLIQVLIGEVQLNHDDQFGIELGLQDQILFDRSGADGPGFLFNSLNALGNNFTDGDVKANADVVGAQAISNFGVGRGDSSLGFGGLVLQASSESVSVLLRALRAQRKLDVLSRPQVMALDNQAAYIQVGQQVPTVTGTTVSAGVQTNSVQYQNTGIILLVRPRISPDGQVVMEVNAEKSDVGPESEGIPVSVTVNGGVLRAPRIDTTRAQTTVSAGDGQTIILGGLITKSKSEDNRRVPGIDRIPIIKHLFRYDADSSRKSELLIILTPHVVHSEADIQRVRQIETARMHWCLSDVIDMHGDLEGGAISLPTEQPTRVFYSEADEDMPGWSQPVPEGQRPQSPTPAMPLPQAEVGAGWETIPRPTPQPSDSDPFYFEPVPQPAQAPPQPQMQPRPQDNSGMNPLRKRRS